MTESASENVDGAPIGWRCQNWKFHVSPAWRFPPHVGKPNAGVLPRT